MSKRCVCAHPWTGHQTWCRFTPSLATPTPDTRLREALRAVLSDFDREPPETYLPEAVRIFHAALADLDKAKHDADGHREPCHLCEAATRAAPTPDTLRETLRANLFDGDESGVATMRITALLDDIVDILADLAANVEEMP